MHGSSRAESGNAGTVDDMKLKVSFVLPAHNEAEMIATTIADVTAIGEMCGTEFEIVVVENGSTDNTAELVSAAAASNNRVQLVELPVGDYGAALHAGLIAAQGELAVIFDCDLYDEVFAKEALSMFSADDNIAVVVASKRHADSQDDRSLFRRAGTATFSTLIRKLCGMKASDSHGMKAVRLSSDVRALVDACQLRGHVFDTELIIRSERAGFTVGELPCNVAELRPARSSYASRVIPALRQAVELRKAVRTTHSRTSRAGLMATSSHSSIAFNERQRTTHDHRIITKQPLQWTRR